MNLINKVYTILMILSLTQCAVILREKYNEDKEDLCFNNEYSKINVNTSNIDSLSGLWRGECVDSFYESSWRKHKSDLGLRPNQSLAPINCHTDPTRLALRHNQQGDDFPATYKKYDPNKLPKTKNKGSNLDITKVIRLPSKLRPPQKSTIEDPGLLKKTFLCDYSDIKKIESDSSLVAFGRSKCLPCYNPCPKPCNLIIEECFYDSSCSSDLSIDSSECWPSICSSESSCSRSSSNSSNCGLSRKIKRKKRYKCRKIKDKCPKFIQYEFSLDSSCGKSFSNRNCRLKNNRNRRKKYRCRPVRKGRPKPEKCNSFKIFNCKSPSNCSVTEGKIFYSTPRETLRYDDYYGGVKDPKQDDRKVIGHVIDFLKLKNCNRIQEKKLDSRDRKKEPPGSFKTRTKDSNATKIESKTLFKTANNLPGINGIRKAISEEIEIYKRKLLNGVYEQPMMSV